MKSIEGDLIELYREREGEFGKRKADRLFIRDVLLLFRRDIIKPPTGTYRLNTYGMLKHNLTIIFRNFKRHKNSFLINLLGLSAGLTSFLMIYLWVSDEIQKDKFHVDGDQLYQVMRTLRSDGTGTFTVSTNSVLLAPSMLAELPEVEMAVPLSEEFAYAVLSSADKKLKSNGVFVGQDYFKLFSFNLIHGDQNQVLKEKESIVISKRLASHFFPETDPLGKVLHLVDNTDGATEYESDYVVTGVFDNSELNSSESYDFLLPYSKFFAQRDQSVWAWDSNNPNVYIRLSRNRQKVDFEKKLTAFYKNKMSLLYGDKPTMSYHMHLQPYSSRYLHNRYENGELSGGRISYVYLFSIIGVLILLIACINFINLSTAVAARRSKEVGVKKVFGIRKKVIASQYLLEAGVMVSITVMLSILLLLVLLPYFNLITGKSLVLQPNLKLTGIMLIVGLATTLLAGSYPAIFLSRLTPLSALSAKIKSSAHEVLVRKGLMVFQFSVSILLVISVLTISRQMEYVQSKNLGYDRDNIITIAKDDGLIQNVQPFLTEVRTISGVKNATILEGEIAMANNQCGGYKRPDRPYIQFKFTRVGYDYVETIGLQLREGRSFSRDFANEDRKIILNETAIRTMGLEDPVGKVVDIRGEREVIGILKDFHYESLHEAIEPMFLIYEPGDATTIAIKLGAGKELETLEALEDVYNKFNPGLPFQFSFHDEAYKRLYESEQKVATLSSWFASIAILISCLGLLGMTAFSTQRRIKEIGIRKVLGASRVRIVSLLGRNMIGTLVLAISIAIPVAYILLGQWLENFSYRIDLSGWFFVAGASIIVLISCITVSYQTWKAASVNPVECIKDE